MAKVGVLAGISEFRVAGLPIGAVAGGALVGGVGDALAGIVTGFAPQFPSWAVKFAAAWGIVQWGPRIFGKDMSQIGGLFLTYDGVQELINIRGSVANLVSGVTGRLVRQSPAVLTGAKPAAAGGDGIPSTYYPSIGRRSG